MYPMDIPHPLDVIIDTSLENEFGSPRNSTIAGSAYAVTANAGQNVHRLVCHVTRSCGFMPSNRSTPTTRLDNTNDASKMPALHAREM